MDDAILGVIVEYRVDARADAAQTARRLVDIVPSFELDTSYEPVPIAPVLDDDEPQAAHPVAELDGATWLVRGQIPQVDVDSLNTAIEVVSVWLDTPIEPFGEEEQGPDDNNFVEDIAAASGPSGISRDCDPTSAKGDLMMVAEVIGADKLWSEGYTGDDITVGIVDGGITATGRAPGGRILNVAGGWPVDSWGARADWAQHGNMCATDVLGIAPNAKLYDIRITSDEVLSTISTAIGGYHWAIEQHNANGTPQVMTNGWGIYQQAWDSSYARDPNHPFARKVVEAIEEGILVLFAAGNGGEYCPSSRCGSDNGPGKSIWGANGHPRVITVGAANTSFELVGYSSQGPAALSADKPDICGISHFRGFTDSDNGTSVACAVAAGAVALMKQARPSLTQDDAKKRLRDAARNLGPPGWDNSSGAGAVNIGGLIPDLVILDGRTKLVHDQPSQRDKLGRAALADEIAALIRELPDEQPDEYGAFAIHLDAPWGAGKSTFVRFVAQRLEPDWLVITLDAWRASQLSPAWWALLSEVREGVRRSKERLHQRIWFHVRRFIRECRRLWRYWVPFALIAAALGVIDVLTPKTDIFASIGSTLTAVVAIGAFATFATRFLSLGTMQGARVHERLNDNPMKDVADQFWWLRAQARKPILLVVDDIDRCNEQFAVETLDAIQTLLRSPSNPLRGRKPKSLVVFVVGDHRWLQAAYDHTYKVFATEVSEPGRPLGRLFLDKLFQLHLDLPKPNPEQMSRYFASLVRPSAPGQTNSADTIKRLEDDVRDVINNADSVDEGLADIARRAQEQLDGDAAEKLAVETLEQRRRDPRRGERERHLLEDFDDLLERNPRAAKRFLMAYNVNYVARYMEPGLSPSDIAQWTILATRWPALADWIREQLPDGPLAPVGVDGHPSQLLLDDEVNRVIQADKGGDGGLTREKVLRCNGFEPKTVTDR